jgi:hypothetical protein
MAPTAVPSPPAQLGIAIAVGVFWWVHRFIGLGATSFAGGLIEQQDAGAAQQGAAQLQALAFAATQVAAVVTQASLEGLRVIRDRAEQLADRTSDSAASAHSSHEYIYRSFGVCPNFRAGGVVVDLGIGRVANS